MPTFSVRVSEWAAARFDAAAGSRGGRSTLLRRLIQDAGADEGGPVTRVPRPIRLMVRLASEDAVIVGAEAQAMGMSPSAWAAALIRWRVSGRPRFRRTDELNLLMVRAEVHRIGVNVNQVARALNTAVLDGRILELELGEIDALRRELREHILGLGAAFAGNLSYWAGEP